MSPLPSSQSAAGDDAGSDGSPSSSGEASTPGDNGPPNLIPGDAQRDRADGCDSGACNQGSPIRCGDGLIESGETCDDGNNVSGDGCSATCQIEPGYKCPTPGQSCVAIQVCGDGVVDGGEQCDDGNTVSGDGCSSICQVEPGWQCPIAGAKCIGAKCGDGIVAGSEQCDDGNIVSGDGCSAICQVEPGFACVTQMAGKSVCHKTVCGDGRKEGFEQCDDRNLIPYDGCSPTCGIEPKCNGKGGCTGVCGDGLVFPEEQCDDGNTVSGDGCSATCQIEPGYTCMKVTQSPASSLSIPILYRDMIHANETTLPTPRPSGGGHPDFESFTPSGKGLVRPTIGADSEPVWASNTPAGATGPALSGSVDFCWWYHETGCNGAGSANPYDDLVYVDAAGAPMVITLAQQATGSSIYSYASTNFFPIDNLGWNAGTNPEVDSACDGTPGHNFSFTSELHYLFTYQAKVAASATPAVFTFSGDDDVYAFINSQLVVDLGGVHPELTGSVTLDTAQAMTLGLTDGGWYSIDLFQAERHTCGSDYSLTLSGFAHVISQCHAICGDSVVAGGEQCDTGAKNVSRASAYGQGVCTTDCRLAPYCGDTTVQAQFGEQCDNGTNLATYGGPNPHACGPGCKWAPYCGDGVVQSSFGEQCDGTPNCDSKCQMIAM
ncbi:MAG: DUF4215 domain-containing protein [Myxococcota bacterium]|nr:DUF4215 domain-containing protein [Myxococcota bacterium]